MRRRYIFGSVLLLVLSSAACAADFGVQPICSKPDEAIMVLEAQSVPSATRLPCIAELPIGWMFSGIVVNDAGTTLWLDHDRAGARALEVELMRSCDTSAAVEVPSAPDEFGMRVYQEPTSLVPYTGTRWLIFDGGCIVYRYRFTNDTEPALVLEADRAMSSIPRATIVASVRRELDVTLCGAGAPDCVG
ncbi:MAG TPA: hypothetical protein VNC60_07425 [Actinomycetota bacterium]|nr:hypothetical protein [Actinomycetota bacterium]